MLQAVAETRSIDQRRTPPPPIKSKCRDRFRRYVWMRTVLSSTGQRLKGLIDPGAAPIQADGRREKNSNGILAGNGRPAARLTLGPAAWARQPRLGVPAYPA